MAVRAGGEDELVVELVEADAPDPVGVVGPHSKLLVRLPNVPEPIGDDISVPFCLEVGTNN